MFGVRVQYRNSPTTIREDVAIPSLQEMCPSNFFERFLSGLESQMVRVVETEIATGLSQLLWCKSLECGLSGNWHEHGERYGAMGKR